MTAVPSTAELIPVNCEPSTAGNPVASSTTTFPFDVPVFATAAVPSPKFVLLVPAFATSDKLFDASKSPCGAAATRLATVTFLVVPWAEPVVSETSVIGMISAVLGVPPRDESELMRRFAIIFFLNQMLKCFRLLCLNRVRSLPVMHHRLR